MFRNIKLSYKLIGGFAIILVLTAIIAYIGVSGVGEIQRKVELADDMNRLIKYSLQMASERRDFTLNGKKEDADKMLKTLADINIQASESREKFKDIDDKKLMDDVIKTHGELKDIFNKYIQVRLAIAKIGQAQTAEYNKLNNELKDEETNMVKVNANLRNYCDDAREIQKQKMQNQVAVSNSLMMVGSIAAIVFGAILAFFITRGITKPINRVVQNITQSTEQVASASNQLSATSQQLAEGSAEQAASIEETSATLEQSSSMVQQNNENIKQASQLSGQTRGSAEKGNHDMQEMMTSMSEIKKSSDQISKIIKVIDEIAFQTNILALNAAVEAARAGDAGMGFAVVAEEVRNLAQRRAQAAKDTAVIIEGNIELSEKGVDVTKKVAESLFEITQHAKKVNELLEEVAAASQEQTQGIMQINKAIVQMEKVTQQNAANAEESASASEELSAQAEIMREIVKELDMIVNGRNEKDIYQRGSERAERMTRTYQNTKSSAIDSGRTIHVKALTGNQIAKKDTKKTHVVRPEDVIPLEDDMRDF